MYKQYAADRLLIHHLTDRFILFVLLLVSFDQSYWRTYFSFPWKIFALTVVCAEGVTFLALGNGAPDIFSAIAAFSHPHTAGLAVGALFGRDNLTLTHKINQQLKLMEILKNPLSLILLVLFPVTGAGIFVTTVVAGSVALVKPFMVASRPFLRDVSFYMVAVFWTFLMLYRKTTTLGETLGTHTHTHRHNSMLCYTHNCSCAFYWF